MSSISDVFMAGIHEVRKSWSRFLLFGILLMILGALCLVKAQTATTFSILALGWILVISSVFWLVTAVQALGWSGFFIYLLSAVIRGVCGYLLIRHPDAGAAGVTMLLAVLFIVSGLFRTAAACVIRFPWWGWTVLSGLVAIGLGVYILVIWGTASTFLVGIVIGVDLIFDSAALIAFAAALRSLPEA
jgi:uncharacterized membrane protein HdeD (DUF308 family)